MWLATWSTCLSRFMFFHFVFSMYWSACFLFSYSLFLCFLPCCQLYTPVFENVAATAQYADDEVGFRLPLYIGIIFPVLRYLRSSRQIIVKQTRHTNSRLSALHFFRKINIYTVFCTIKYTIFRSELPYGMNSYRPSFQIGSGWNVAGSSSK